MRFLVLSDLHLEFAPHDVTGEDGFDAVILAGDIHAPGRRAVAWALGQPAFAGKPVVLLAGNHEFYDTCLPDELQAIRDAALGSNVHFLSRTSVVLDDPAGGQVRVLGCTLWTDFEFADAGFASDQVMNMFRASRYMSDYRAISLPDEDGGLSTKPRRLFTPKDALERHLSERAWLLEQLSTPFNGKTVVVSHHGPSGLSVSPKFRGDELNSSFVSELPSTFFEVPALWVHGHTHASADYILGNTRVLCNPRGYRRRDGSFENPQFDASLVAAV